MTIFSDVEVKVYDNSMKEHQQPSRATVNHSSYLIAISAVLWFVRTLFCFVVLAIMMYYM